MDASRTVAPENRAEREQLCQYVLRNPFSVEESFPPGSPPPPLTLPSRKWRDLIRQAWHVDPLQCPVCQKQMRMIAFIDNPEVVEKILSHMKLWAWPKAGRPEALGFSSSLFA